MEQTKLQGHPYLGPTTPRQRPKSEIATHPSHLSPLKNAPNYILITQELLNEFKTEVVKSSKVTLKFSSIKYRQPKEFAYKSKLPPLFAERLQMIQDKAATSLDFSRQYRGRPVKVHVEDITKVYSERRGPSSNRAKTSRETSKQTTISNKSTEISAERSLDSGDEGDGGEDAIDSVARANSIQAEHHPGHVLPEIRAAPCPIHIKQDKGKGQDVLYSTTSHVRDIKMFKRFQPHPIKSISIQQHVSSQETLKGNKMGISVKVPGQYPVKPPTLPKNMSSKDYVMSWLIHGSAPQGSNHFPEIVPGQTNAKSKYGRKKLGTSE